MEVNRTFKLTKNDIRSAIVGYIEDIDYINDDDFIESFEVEATDDDNHVIRINMNDGVRRTNVECFVTVHKTK